MINEDIKKFIINTSNASNKNLVLNELLNHISIYDRNDNRAAHVLAMLVERKAIVSKLDVNLDYIDDNLDILIDNSDKYSIRNIKINYIDNINCIIKISFEYAKIVEDIDNMFYSSTYTIVNFIEHPDILKKC